MAGIKGSTRKRERATGDSHRNPSLEQGTKAEADDPFDREFSSDIKGIISALQQIKDKAQRDSQKKTEETISSLASDIKSMVDEAKQKIDKDRQNFLKALMKSSKECENSLKDEASKFQALDDKFCKERTQHLQAFQNIFSKYEDEKEKLFVRYEQQRKKEKAMLANLEKACGDKIAAAECSLKKKKQDDKSFSILRKSLGSFLGGSSDDEYPPEEDE
ncbi:uncharacterized protein LOC116245934 [Nymphaea colorata]|nr:uncharacterized protein LOC116245934 [Nymphaea colorata]